MGGSSHSLPTLCSAAGASVLGRPWYCLRPSAALSWLQRLLGHLAAKVANSSGCSLVGSLAQENISTQARDGTQLHLCCELLTVGLLTVWRWANSLLSLRFIFLVCKMGIITASTLQDYYEDRSQPTASINHQTCELTSPQMIPRFSLRVIHRL